MTTNKLENVTIGLKNDIYTVADERDENLAKLEVATLTIIFILTIIGNSTVLLALWIRWKYFGRKKLTRMYYFILHLSIADLITAFFNVLPQIGWDITYRFRGGFVLCKLVKFVQTLGPYLSSYILVATAVDRYHAICYPLSYCAWSSKWSKIMIWIAWTTALVFCIPQVIVFKYQQIAIGISDCWATLSQPWEERAYVTWYSISVFMVPLIVLIYTYGRICNVIWRSGELSLTLQRYASDISSHDSRMALSSRQQPLITRAKIKTIKQTIAVITMYVLCSTPFISAQLWATWSPRDFESPFISGAAFTILTLLSSLNSCVNPWIYLTFNKALPRHLFSYYICTGKNFRHIAI